MCQNEEFLSQCSRINLEIAAAIGAVTNPKMKL